MFSVIKRDPTSVELFDMAQSNSEHSRHWFFRGILEIDGKKARDPHAIPRVTTPRSYHTLSGSMHLIWETDIGRAKKTLGEGPACVHLVIKPRRVALSRYRLVLV